MLAIFESQNWWTKLMPALTVTSSNKSSGPAGIGGVTASAATGWVAFPVPGRAASHFVPSATNPSTRQTATVMAMFRKGLVILFIGCYG